MKKKKIEIEVFLITGLVLPLDRTVVEATTKTNKFPENLQVITIVKMNKIHIKKEDQIAQFPIQMMINKTINNLNPPEKV